MKCNRWTVALAAAGLVTLPSLVHAEETANPVLTAMSSTTLSGYVDTSIQWNIGSGNAITPFYAFGGTAKADGFNLNVVKLSLEKPVDVEDTWGAGYKADLLFGPDANVLATTSTSAAGSARDFAIKQAYVALRAPVGNGLDLKIGVFDTLIGYEVFESGNNPNHTRSYGYTIEPTTHTGVLGSYAFNDMVSVSAGIANTFGPTINGRANPPKAESYKTYMGSVTFTAPEDWGWVAGSTLSGGVINGFNGGFGADQTSWYVGGTMNTPLSNLKLGASYDYLGISGQPLTGGGSLFANAIAGYAMFQATEKLSLNLRGEYATAGAFLIIGPKKVVAATVTAQYDLWANVISRLEFRWDHAADGTPIYGPGKKNSYILLANFIYKF